MYGPYQTPRFWQNYQPQLKGFVRKRISDPDAAKDVLQDIFIKIYTHCQKFDFSCQKAGIVNLRAWIFQTAQNTVNDYYRKGKNHQDLDTIADLNLQHLAYEENTNSYHDMSAYVQYLLLCLPEIYRVPLSMELDGVAQKKIAQQLGMGLPAIKSRIQRARQLFKKLTQECFYLNLDQKGRIDSFEAKPDCQILKCIQNQTPGCSVHLTRHE